MENYQTQTEQPTPKTKPVTQMTELELAEFLQNTRNRDNALLALREANFRKDKTLEELTKTIARLEKRVALLEDKTLKKAGRKRQVYNFDGKELTDDYLVYLIDYDLATIGKLEKIVGAKKNVLRNRYNKAKKKQLLKRQVMKNGNP